MAESLGIPGASVVDYSVERQRSRSEGIVACAVAGPDGTPTAFIRVAAPQEFESVYWSACKQGGAPTVPSPESLTSDNNRIFLCGQQSAVIPVPTIGGHYFIIVGVYHFALQKPEGLSSNFNLGKLPWENQPAEMIPSQFFAKYGILTDQTSVALPTGTLRPR